jgi:peptide/nickel transport system permease protein
MSMNEESTGQLYGARAEAGWAWSRRLPRTTARWVRQYPLGAFGAFLVIVVLVVAAVGSTFLKYGPLEIVGTRLASPSSEHLLGTDNFARDLLARTVAGARISVFIAVSASALALVISLILGTVGGFSGRWVDGAIGSFVNAVMAFPSLLLLMSIVAYSGPGVRNVALILGILPGIRYSRVIRSAVLSIKGSQYVEAAQSMGATQLRLMVRHIVPNTFGPAMVLVSTVWGVSILAEASLSFLGLGVPPPTPSWCPGRCRCSARWTPRSASTRSTWPSC